MYRGQDYDEITIEVGDIINVVEYDNPEDMVSGALLQRKLYNPVGQRHSVQLKTTTGLISSFLSSRRKAG